MIKKMDSYLHKLTSGICLVSYAAFIAVMIIIVLDVALRKITQSGIMGTYEIVERALMCGVFASYAYTQSEHGHVRVTMFISKLPGRLRLVVNALTYIISSAGAFLLTYAAVLQGNYSQTASTMTGVLHIPLFPFFWIEAVCMAVFGIALLWEVIKSFAALGNKEIAQELTADWD